MPRFDQQCTDCDWRGEIVARPHEQPPCPKCGGATERVWVSSFPAVVDDSVPGGFVVENMGPEPIRFDSKSEWRAEMKRRGLVNNVRHVGVPGSDKSPATSRWI